MDSQSRISDEPEALAESRFLAARDGMSAHLVDGPRGNRRPVNGALAEVLEECQRRSPPIRALSVSAGSRRAMGSNRSRRCLGRSSYPPGMPPASPAHVSLKPPGFY
jgi:hypothetical protein